MVPGGNLDAAASGWRQALGADRVTTTPDEFGRFGSSTLAQAAVPAAVVRAVTADEVVAIVQVARENEVPLYPVSQGRNWGYGDACPVGPGQAVLDLSGMNRIIEVDPELAYAVIEPGVTQGQLHAHLEHTGCGLISACTGSAPDASVVGNMIERGFGPTPYGEHAANACGLEVVLADGTLVKTGMAAYEGSATAHVYRWGLGPSLDGLFSQSNLGIVVKAGVWLMPKPAAMTTFSLELESDADLGRAIDQLRRLRLQRTLTGPVYIANVFRTLAHMGRYPWHETNGDTPLSRELAEKLVRRRAQPGRGGRYNAIGALQGTERGVEAAVRDVAEALDSTGKLTFTSASDIDRFERRGRMLSRVPKLSERGRRMVATASVARSGLSIFQGVPSDQALAISRWRLRSPVKGICVDPTAEGCGLYWVAPVCPANGTDVNRCLRIIEDRVLSDGFEPLIRIAMTTDRSLFLTTLIAFDRRHKGERQAARDCHRALTAELIEAGYPPYRAGIDEMDLLDPHGSSHWAVVAALKRALDPDGVLAPGRYEPAVAAALRAPAAG
ncbi:MAG: FAD-binding oxidoreductase [Baekduia sp.]